ncbi:MAG: hypothetical protein AMJ93_09610 [Anaerolineae bacterium SM23_84]|nr:MAG: hypothetical protein AMJ93_09610 [Anaerolineae bacterium SM23_84]
MKRLTLLLLAVLLLLIAAVPSSARPAAGKDTVRLKVFVHYPRFGKPPQPPKGPKPPTPGTCDPTSEDSIDHYGLGGWRLSGLVEYQVNEGTIPASVQDPLDAIANSFQVWEAQAQGEVGFAYGGSTRVKVARNDGLHIVAWGNVSLRDAIAVTYIWYYPSTGDVVDVDTIMNVRLPWSYTRVTDPDQADQVCGDLYSYEAQNILTHELGHWMGLDDLYDSMDKDLTMYGYGDKGELKKETLGLGDMLGIGELY